MFKISYKDLRSQHFMTSMQKIARSTDYRNMKVTFRVAKLCKALEKAVNQSQVEWVKVADQLIQKDEKKNYKLGTDGFEWLDGVDPKVGEKAVEDYMAKEVIIENAKLKLFDLEPVKLSPADISNLECLLEITPDLEAK